MIDIKPDYYLLSKFNQFRIFLSGSVGLIVLSILYIMLFSFGANFFLSSEAYQSLIESSQFLVALNFIVYFSIMVIFISWLSKTTIIKQLFLSFFNGTKLQKSLIYFGLLYAMLIGLNLVYELLGIRVEDNTNQETITQLTLSFPFLSFITFVFLGPIVEEITYRLGLFSLVRRYNRWLGYLITALVFGFIHFDYGSADYMNELINMPLYVFAGVLFTFIYEKEGFEVATLTHILNNGFSILIIWIISWSTSSL
jgi:membrane protease YdiL (CAAX protease family)